MIWEGKRFGKSLKWNFSFNNTSEDSFILLMRIEFKVVLSRKFRNISLTCLGIGLINPDEIETSVEKY